MATIFKQYDILLDIKRATTNNKIEVVEGDNGNIFHITLTDNNEAVDLSGTRVVAVFSNGDGTVEQDTSDAPHGEYVFTYNGSAWILDGFRSTNVFPAYGITLTGGTPASGNTVTVTYDEDSITAATTVTGATVSVDSTDFVRAMSSVIAGEGDDSNEIYILVHSGSYSSSGINECEIQVYSGVNYDVLVTTAKFNFQSRRSSINEETILSEEKYPILVDLISKVQQALAKAMPYTSVTITAHHVNGLPTVSATITEDSVSWDFGIPNGVHIGTTAPEGDEEVWIDTSNDLHPDNLMTTAVYDTDNDGIVDNSEALNGHADTYFASATDLSTGLGNITELKFTSGFTFTWASNTHSSDTDASFPYRASIPLTGVTATMMAEVVFGAGSAMSGIYSPICECYAGGVYIWASEQTNPTILSVLVHK